MTSGSHSETTCTSPIRRATALAVACGYLLTLLYESYSWKGRVESKMD